MDLDNLLKKRRVWALIGLLLGADMVPAIKRLLVDVVTLMPSN